MTWADFVDDVLGRLSDTAPTDAAFSEAQAAYVRARMALELDRDSAGYTIHQNRYTALRRRLCGYATTLSSQAQAAAVRALVADGTADDTQFALACAYWVKAHMVNDLSRDSAASGWMVRFREQRRRLLGFTPSFADADALKVAVTPFLSPDAPSISQSAYYDAQLAAADSEMRGLLAWFSAQLAAAANDLMSLRARVLKEVRAATILLQDYVPAYLTGHVTSVVAGDVIAEGASSSGTLPDGAMLREAWVIYREDGAEAEVCDRLPAERVGWDNRHDLLICRQDEDPPPVFAVARNGRDYLVLPALVADEIELELIWDGKRLEFEDADETPFDEGAAEAAAWRVQSALAAEFGLGVSEAREFERRFNDRMGECYIETNQRGRGRF